MKTPAHSTSLAGSTLAVPAFILIFSLIAAALPAVQGAAIPAVPTDVVELSPFEVSSAKDTGYAAQSTLSGTRVNTDVKDIGGTMTIITPEVMEDLALTSTNDILRFTPGAEKNDVQEADGLGQARQDAGVDAARGGIVGGQLIVVHRLFMVSPRGRRRCGTARRPAQSAR